MNKITKIDKTARKYFESRTIKLKVEDITKVCCPRCSSNKCLKASNGISYSSLYCPNCQYKLTFWYAMDKKCDYVTLDKSKEFTIENLTSIEFLEKTPFGIYLSESKDETHGFVFEEDNLLTMKGGKRTDDRILFQYKIKGEWVHKTEIYKSFNHESLKTK